MINAIKEKILIPGECVFDDVRITSYNGFVLDIKNHISEIVINESIDAVSVSGYVMIADNINLIRNIPLIGNEKLTLTYYTPSRPKITKTFFCYKIDAKIDSENNKNGSLYRLHFVSEEYVTCLKKKISISFQNKKYSEMVFDIYSSYVNTSKKIKIQETLDKKNIVFCYTDPFSAINDLAIKSVSFDNKDKSFVFYEDMDGYNFCNINYKANMIGPVAEYSWFPVNTSESRDPLIIKNLEKEFYRIESFEKTSHINTLHNIENGLYSSVLLAHDITYKTVKAKVFNYNYDYLNLNKLYPNGILPKTNDKFSDYNYSHYRLYPRQSYAYDNVEINDDYTNCVLEKNAHLKQLENNRINILVAGDSQRRVGESIIINIPSMQPSLFSNEDYDPYISGKYIITKITHMISPYYYKMRLYLERDSIPISYPEQKIVEIKE